MHKCCQYFLMAHNFVINSIHTPSLSDWIQRIWCFVRKECHFTQKMEYLPIAFAVSQIFSFQLHIFKHLEYFVTKFHIGRFSKYVDFKQSEYASFHQVKAFIRWSQPTKISDVSYRTDWRPKKVNSTSHAVLMIQGLCWHCASFCANKYIILSIFDAPNVLH